MPSWLITGSNRGIGFAVVQHLLKDESNYVIATARRAVVPEFEELKAQYGPTRFASLEIDVTKPESVRKAAEAAVALLPNGLDYIVNNAGANENEHAQFEDIDLDAFGHEVAASVVGPLSVSRTFLPLVKKSEKKTIIFITSILGSMAASYTLPSQMNAYSVAKAAANMLGRKWGATLKDEGVVVGILHPGWVKTPIGDSLGEWIKKNKPDMVPISTDESAAGIIKVAEGLTLANTALFWNYDGSSLPW